jgi:hypothetical protein
VIVYQQADSQFKGWYLDNLFGNLWRRQEWEIYAPTRVGQVLRCSARVADRYRRRDRDVVAQEMWVRDEDGRLIARSIHHQSFLAEQTSGEVTLREPASKDGARQRGEPSGEPLSVELRKTFTDAMCDEFFYRSRNYHNDKAASKELGFGDTVIGGRMTLSCVTELLTRHFGRGFYLGGRGVGHPGRIRRIGRPLHNSRPVFLEPPGKTPRPQVEGKVHEPAMPIRGYSAEPLFHRAFPSQPTISSSPMYGGRCARVEASTWLRRLNIPPRSPGASGPARSPYGDSRASTALRRLDFHR